MPAFAGMTFITALLQHNCFDNHSYKFAPEEIKSAFLYGTTYMSPRIIYMKLEDHQCTIKTHVFVHIVKILKKNRDRFKKTCLYNISNNKFYHVMSSKYMSSEFPATGEPVPADICIPTCKICVIS